MAEIDYDEFIDEIKKCLDFPPGKVDGSLYMYLQRHLAKINQLKGDELQSIYHLTEAHGAGMRQLIIYQDARKELNEPALTELLEFKREPAKDQVGDLRRRLGEMPPEWTLVQLTREFEPEEMVRRRRAETSPRLGGVHVTRLPCGGREEELPVSETVRWDSEKDLLDVFWEVKKSLSTKTGSASHIRKLRSQVSADIESYLKEIGGSFFKQWVVLLLGRLYDKSLEADIRSRVDTVLESSSVRVTERQRYLSYVLAEGCAHLKDGHIEKAARQTLPPALASTLTEAVIDIKENMPTLSVVKRHPVILILDDRLEIVSWESMLELRRHPVSRVGSVHLAERLHGLHKGEVNGEGLREVVLRPSDPGFYLVDPDGDLPGVRERLCKFLKKRMPEWSGVVGQKPPEEDIIRALTSVPTFIYCGHGSGCQYVGSEAIQRLRLTGVQMLYGCSSAALKDHGGTVEMSGDVLQFTIAGSGCTLGMLWPVTSNDTDRMTMTLANAWLPGPPVDINTFEETGERERQPQERELLRAMRAVRDCVETFSNGAALIARGIPVKLVPHKEKT